VRRDPKGAALDYYRWATRLRSGGNAFDGYPEAWKRAGIEHAQASLREIIQLIPPKPPTSKVRQMSCPVTLLIGDLGQPVFQRTTRRLQGLMPHARLVGISETSHLISTDQPRQTAAVIASAIGMA
jgi:pimeloyl-ACP methyl ester carboxylesterase